ncbi:MAG: response regulator [Kineosporiaceae bacterium]
MDDPADATVTVAVVEDHPLYREALVGAVSSAPQFRVTAAVGSIAELARAEERPGIPVADVVVLDLHLPGVRGCAGVRGLAGAGRVVLVVSAAARPATVQEALAAGARGYLTKDADAGTIVAAIRTLAAGGVLDPPPAVAGIAGEPEAGRGAAALTSRELQVLALLAEGKTDQGIAAELVISVRTVQSHLDRIREKTGRRRRPELTRLAVEVGVVDDTEPPG